MSRRIIRHHESCLDNQDLSSSTHRASRSPSKKAPRGSSCGASQASDEGTCLACHRPSRKDVSTAEYWKRVRSLSRDNKKRMDARETQWRLAELEETKRRKEILTQRRKEKDELTEKFMRKPLVAVRSSSVGANHEKSSLITVSRSVPDLEEAFRTIQQEQLARARSQTLTSYEVWSAAREKQSPLFRRKYNYPLGVTHPPSTSPGKKNSRGRIVRENQKAYPTRTIEELKARQSLYTCNKHIPSSAISRKRVHPKEYTSSQTPIPSDASSLPDSSVIVVQRPKFIRRRSMPDLTKCKCINSTMVYESVAALEGSFDSHGVIVLQKNMSQQSPQVLRKNSRRSAKMNYFPDSLNNGASDAVDLSLNVQGGKKISSASSKVSSKSSHTSLQISRRKEWTAEQMSKKEMKRKVLSGEECENACPKQVQELKADVAKNLTFSSVLNEGNDSSFYDSLEEEDNQTRDSTKKKKSFFIPLEENNSSTPTNFTLPPRLSTRIKFLENVLQRPRTASDTVRSLSLRGKKVHPLQIEALLLSEGFVYTEIQDFDKGKLLNIVQERESEKISSMRDGLAKLPELDKAQNSDDNSRSNRISGGPKLRSSKSVILDFNEVKKTEISQNDLNSQSSKLFYTKNNNSNFVSKHPSENKANVIYSNFSDSPSSVKLKNDDSTSKIPVRRPISNASRKGHALNKTFDNSNPEDEIVDISTLSSISSEASLSGMVDSNETFSLETVSDCQSLTEITVNENANPLIDPKTNIKSASKEHRISFIEGSERDRHSSKGTRNSNKSPNEANVKVIEGFAGNGQEALLESGFGDDESYGSDHETGTDSLGSCDESKSDTQREKHDSKIQKDEKSEENNNAGVSNNEATSNETKEMKEDANHKQTIENEESLNSVRECAHDIVDQCTKMAITDIEEELKNEYDFNQLQDEDFKLIDINADLLENYSENKDIGTTDSVNQEFGNDSFLESGNVVAVKSQYVQTDFEMTSETNAEVKHEDGHFLSSDQENETENTTGRGNIEAEIICLDEESEEAPGISSPRENAENSIYDDQKIECSKIVENEHEMGKSSLIEDENDSIRSEGVGEMHKNEGNELDLENEKDVFPVDSCEWKDDVGAENKRNDREADDLEGILVAADGNGDDIESKIGTEGCGETENELIVGEDDSENVSDNFSREEKLVVVEDEKTSSEYETNQAQTLSSGKEIEDAPESLQCSKNENLSIKNEAIEEDTDTSLQIEDDEELTDQMEGGENHKHVKNDLEVTIPEEEEEKKDSSIYSDDKEENVNIQSQETESEENDEDNQAFDHNMNKAIKHKLFEDKGISCNLINYNEGDTDDIEDKETNENSISLFEKQNDALEPSVTEDKEKGDIDSEDKETENISKEPSPLAAEMDVSDTSGTNQEDEREEVQDGRDFETVLPEESEDPLGNFSCNENEMESELPAATLSEDESQGGPESVDTKSPIDKANEQILESEVAEEMVEKATEKENEEKLEGEVVIIENENEDGEKLNEITENEIKETEEKAIKENLQGLSLDGMDTINSLTLNLIEDGSESSISSDRVTVVRNLVNSSRNSYSASSTYALSDIEVDRVSDICSNVEEVHVSDSVEDQAGNITESPENYEHEDNGTVLKNREEGTQTSPIEYQSAISLLGKLNSRLQENISFEDYKSISEDILMNHLLSDSIKSLMKKRSSDDGSEDLCSENDMDDFNNAYDIIMDEDDLAELTRDEIRSTDLLAEIFTAVTRKEDQSPSQNIDSNSDLSTIEEENEQSSETIEDHRSDVISQVEGNNTHTDSESSDSKPFTVSVTQQEFEIMRDQIDDKILSSPVDEVSNEATEERTSGGVDGEVDITPKTVEESATYDLNNEIVNENLTENDSEMQKMESEIPSSEKMVSESQDKASGEEIVDRSHSFSEDITISSEEITKDETFTTPNNSLKIDYEEDLSKESTLKESIVEIAADESCHSESAPLDVSGTEELDTTKDIEKEHNVSEPLTERSFEASEFDAELSVREDSKSTINIDTAPEVEGKTNDDPNADKEEESTPQINLVHVNYPSDDEQKGQASGDITGNNSVNLSYMDKKLKKMKLSNNKYQFYSTRPKLKDSRAYSMEVVGKKPEKRIEFRSRSNSLSDALLSPRNANQEESIETISSETNIRSERGNRYEKGSSVCGLQIAVESHNDQRSASFEHGDQILSSKSPSSDSGVMELAGPSKQNKSVHPPIIREAKDDPTSSDQLSESQTLHTVMERKDKSLLSRILLDPFRSDAENNTLSDDSHSEDNMYGELPNTPLCTDSDTSSRRRKIFSHDYVQTLNLEASPVTDRDYSPEGKSCSSKSQKRAKKVPVSSEDESEVHSDYTLRLLRAFERRRRRRQRHRPPNIDVDDFSNRDYRPPLLSNFDAFLASLPNYQSEEHLQTERGEGSLASGSKEVTVEVSSGKELHDIRVKAENKIRLLVEVTPSKTRKKIRVAPKDESKMAAATSEMFLTHRRKDRMMQAETSSEDSWHVTRFNNYVGKNPGFGERKYLQRSSSLKSLNDGCDLTVQGNNIEKCFTGPSTGAYRQLLNVQNRVAPAVTGRKPRDHDPNTKEQRRIQRSIKAIKELLKSLT